MRRCRFVEGRPAPYRAALLTLLAVLTCSPAAVYFATGLYDATSDPWVLPPLPPPPAAVVRLERGQAIDTRMERKRLERKEKVPLKVKGTTSFRPNAPQRAIRKLRP
jgi:hypothetical protein